MLRPVSIAAIGEKREHVRMHAVAKMLYSIYYYFLKFIYLINTFINKFKERPTLVGQIKVLHAACMPMDNINRSREAKQVYINTYIDSESGRPALAGFDKFISVLRVLRMGWDLA